MRIVLVVMALALGTALPRQASADPSSHAARSQAHYEAGRVHFRAGDFAEAVREFEEGYRWEPRPLFLFLIGQAARRDKQVDKALRSYRQFLELDRNAPERAKVLQYIAELERELASAAPVTPAPTPTVSEPTPAVPTPAAAVPAPAAPAQAAPAPAAPAQAAPAQVSSAPVVAPRADVITAPHPTTMSAVVATPARRRGMWAGIGVGIGIVVGGVILAVVLTTPRDVPTSPLGNYRWVSP